MSPTETAAWEQVRSCGRGKFIGNRLFSGGLRFTAPIFFAYYLVGLFTHPNPDIFPEAREVCLMFGLLTLLIGWHRGVAEWRKRERIYQVEPDQTL